MTTEALSGICEREYNFRTKGQRQFGLNRVIHGDDEGCKTHDA